MNVPDDRRYTKDHEWAIVIDNAVRIGITDYAQDALGDVVFVGLPSVGLSVTSGSSFAEVESTKSVSDIYAPIDGDISQINEELGDRPELLNEDPYGEGWICEIAPKEIGALSELLTAAEYLELIAGG